MSDTTLRRRRDEWVAAGVFDRLADEAITAWDRIMGLRLDDVCVDGSTHKAPCGGEGTGKSPVDRRKLGWKWSVATDATGTPVAWAAAGANRNDIMLFEPTMDRIEQRELHHDIDTMHLDRGYWGARVDRSAADIGITDLVRPPTQAQQRQPSQARQRAAGTALASRTHQLMAVQLRATTAQHRPTTTAQARPARPRHHLDHHLDHHHQTHRPPQPLEPPLTHLLAQPLIGGSPFGSVRK